MPSPCSFPRFEFHIARAAREAYAFDDTLFSLTGNVVLADLAAVRRLAARVNARRAALAPPKPALSPGDLNAMGLIDEALHLVVAAYQRERDPRSMIEGLESAEGALGRDELDRTLLGFVERFPGAEVHRGETTAAAWLAGATGGVPHHAVALEELLLLWLANRNAAFGPFSELFDDRALPGRAAYLAAIEALGAWFATRPRFGPFDQSLVDMLRSPAIEFPDSLAGQLDYIRRHWGHLLGDFALRLLTGLDVLGEEAHARWLAMSPGIGERPADSGPDAIPHFDRGEHEPERFSPDRDWMPRVVLIAKSVYVWLDQLSRQYSREVRRLDQIPDEELDRLARWGVNGVWLIGVWERSRASQRIKQLCGNPDAAASAYSLLDYDVAGELGGGEALAALKARAWARGIRMASDMVPNHMGIDSRWVIEHPDWFLSLREPPFPAYSFNGPDVSADDRVVIQIEDHYYDRTDAAVVFKRTDRASGDTRFIYHGNDGTSYPWNDTAQLDYLRPEVREGLIQTIVHVARQFPIIRFDAAMTLAKRHYQRLWFPEPGSGGAIPSRAEHGLTRAAFDAAMPQEFWREVVDRMAVEAPETLLLAEAFWLMEGFFVRTLGMHRVYNSAFMNMLRDEQNANYRSVIRNTIEFDPEILKRYVNFMSNPDERTAADQFARGDKYFGVCTLMATLPGLPMFGHGQIEGFEERYGMEYRRAYRDESVDAELVSRHEREIFPLLHRRALFAEVGGFRLYDCFGPDGQINEDVFAYSNRHGDERALVIYHNRYAEAAGWIHNSAAFAVGTGGARRLERQSLGEALGLTRDDGRFCRFRDFAHGLEYLRPSRDLCERGFYTELGAYQRHVFLDIREVCDSAHEPWGTLAAELGGRGAGNLDDALDEIRRRPLTTPWRELLAPATLVELSQSSGDAAGPDDATMAIVETRARALLEAAATMGMTRVDPARRAAALRGRIDAWRREASTAAASEAKRAAAPGASPRSREHAPLPAPVPATPPAFAQPDWLAPRTWGLLLAFEAARALGDAAGLAAQGPDRVADLVREWRLDRVAREALLSLGLDGEFAARSADTLLALLAQAVPFEDAARQGARAERVFAGWLADDSVRRQLGVHVHADVEWFGKESFEDWFALLTTVSRPDVTAAARETPRETGRETGRSGATRGRATAPAESYDAWCARIASLARASGWRTDALLLRGAAQPGGNAPAGAASSSTSGARP